MLKYCCYCRWGIWSKWNEREGVNEMKINRPVSAGRFGLACLSLTVRRRGEKNVCWKGLCTVRACLFLSLFLLLLRSSKQVGGRAFCKWPGPKLRSIKTVGFLGIRVLHSHTGTRLAIRAIEYFHRFCEVVFWVWSRISRTGLVRFIPKLVWS